MSEDAFKALLLGAVAVFGFAAGFIVGELRTYRKFAHMLDEEAKK